MGYNHLRANIRNAMVGMTVTEATEFVESFKFPESKGYAEEFVQELRDEEYGWETSY